MKLITLEVTWRTLETFEVDDDWRCPSTLDGFTEEQLDQMTSQNAELTDWEVP